VSLYQQIYAQRWEQPDRVRDVWRVLVGSYFQRLIPEDAVVLDVGCGHCYFLNHVRAKRRVGIDANEEARQYAAPGVEIIVSADVSLRALGEARFDRMFMSNFLEHLASGEEVIRVFQALRQRLKPGGKLIILQPNFRLVGAAYFDFIDHKVILTERSLGEALAVAGYEIERCIVRFLPYTTQSRLPQHPWLVWAYLRLSPLWLLLGKQTLVVARPAAGASAA
jgi:SAM-dependent methyltransferase